MKKTPFSATAGIVFRFTTRRCYRALTVALAGLSCLSLWLHHLEQSTYTDNSQQFRRLLKTHLFNLAYN